MGVNVATMHAGDALAGNQAECYVTIKGNRYNFMQAKDFETKLDKNKVEIPILGRMGKGNKATGWKGTFSATFYYNTSIFRKVMQHYKDTGEDLYFEIQVTNEDLTSKAGRQTMVFIDCNLDGGILAKFVAGDEALEEEMSGTLKTLKCRKNLHFLKA